MMERADHKISTELGGIPPDFENRVLADMQHIEPNQSIHRTFMAVADRGIAEKAGVDTLVRFIRQSKRIKAVLAGDVAEAIEAHFPAPSPMPDHINRDIITRAVYDMVGYFVQHVHAGSFYDYLGSVKANPDWTPEECAEYSALLASDRFQRALMRAFQSFFQVIVDDRLIRRMENEPETRRSYFGHFVSRLIEERADASTWVRLFVDAIRYRVDAREIYQLAADAQGPAQVRDETRFVLGEQREPHFADRNFLVQCAAQAETSVALNDKRTAEYVAGLKNLKNLPAGAAADIFHHVDPFALLLEYWKMPANGEFHHGLIWHIDVYFDTMTASGPNGDPRFVIDEHLLNEAYYWEDTPQRPRFAYKARRARE